MASLVQMNFRYTRGKRMQKDQTGALSAKLSKARLKVSDKPRHAEAPSSNGTKLGGDHGSGKDAHEQRNTHSNHQLSLQVSQLSNELKVMKNRLNMLADFYEMKIDSIYQTISNVLPAMIRNGSVVVPTDSAKVESTPVSTFVKMDVESWAKEIAATSSGILDQGVYRAPFIFAGFKFHDHVDVRPEYIEVPGAMKGIAMFGPYKSLLPGDYVVECYVSAIDDGKTTDAFLDVDLDVFDASQNNVLTTNTFRESFEGYKTTMLRVVFTCLPEQSDSEFEFRLHQNGDAPFRIHKLHVIHNG